MKLICLNVWGGKAYEPLMKFVKEQSATTDIFCFQEVFKSPRKDMKTSNGSRVHILDEIAAALPGFNYNFHPISEKADNAGLVDFDIESCLAEFVKKPVHVLSSGEKELHLRKKPGFDGNIFNPRVFGYTKVRLGNSSLRVINVHGYVVVSEDSKLDDSIRLEQSQEIKEFVEKEDGPVVICGDFNVRPEAKSITMFEDKFENLIKKFRISRTRSKLHLWYGKPDEYKISDYVFVSPEIKVSKFEVPDVEISDHLPLIVEFN